LIRSSYTFLIIVLLLSSFTTAGQAAPAHQESTPEEKARALLGVLTPEEKVGQLFLVTFNGPEAGPSSQIADPNAKIYNLIAKYHVGGVILLAANDNFVGGDQTISVAQSLTQQLQVDAYNASQQEQANSDTGKSFLPAYIPLFVGTVQEGDGFGYDQILDGLTPLPSQMAIGATWQSEEARKVGVVLGSELTALGFNLLLGPSLDVLEAPYSESGGDLGVRTFGGDPFWVGEMGRAYIAGVHQGSNSRMVVVAKHFPGFGGSDRLPEDEVATVPKSLEQLKQIELYPFFAVTGNAPSTEATADALLTSHISYRGLLGNFRATTKPVSFDQEAISLFMSLPQFTKWRENGGVMISDELGCRAVRQFYDPSGQSFNSKRVALDAFQAGNDLLYLGDFTASEDPDSYTSIVSTLDAFTRKYREDMVFAQRVDAAVLRILTLKYRIYNNSPFTLKQTLTSGIDASQLGRSSQTTFEVAQRAATLLSPLQSELADALPAQPGQNDRIVFISDTRVIQQCSKCNQQQVLTLDGLQQAVLKLYSPTAADLVLPRNLISYSFQDLLDMLNAGTGVKQIENDLRQAKWIVFAILNVDTSVPSSTALRRFLAERRDLIQQKWLVAFAFNAPYFLGATDIAKLNAYYGLYSREAQFIEVAARLLFQEERATGAPPVSIPGINYNLNDATLPDPSQTIQLILDLPQPETSSDTGTTSTPIPTPAYRVGDTIPLRTSVILDHNGNPVPDDTPVQFKIIHGADTSITQQEEAKTVQGIAKAVLRVEGFGPMEIYVESYSAKSDSLKFEIPSEIVSVTVVPPTPTPTDTPTPTPTPTPTLTPTFTPTPNPTITLTAVPTPTITPTSTPKPLRDHPYISEWLLALFVAAAIGISNYWLAVWTSQLRWGLRGGFLALIGGLLAYSYLALGMPGSTTLIHKAGSWGIILITFFGACIGMAGTWVWREIQSLRN
jgi:beta-N-acetylhexosaminidase